VIFSTQHAAPSTQHLCKLAALALALVVLFARASAAQDIHLIVIVGAGGDEEHSAKFHQWAAAVVDAAKKRGVSDAVYLGEKQDPSVNARATKENVTKAFQDAAKKARPEDELFVLLIGHGSFDGQNARFNLPGPDMNAGDFNALMKKLPAKQLVFVNASSASGPFVETLSAPGRTIITATRSGAEHYATLFGGFFVDAFTSADADQDKNQRVTMLEAFRFAKAGVARAYEQEGLLATEHAMLDDDGDKQGSQEPAAGGKDSKCKEADGKMAAVISLGSTESDGLPTDPKLRALYVERRDMERRVESLRLLKDSMDPARYASELEKAATDLALKNREIRQTEGK